MSFEPIIKNRKPEGTLENGRKHAPWFAVIKFKFCANSFVFAKQNKIAAKFCPDLLIGSFCQASWLTSVPRSN